MKFLPQDFAGINRRKFPCHVQSLEFAATFEHAMNFAREPHARSVSPDDFRIRTERLWSSVVPIHIGECLDESGMPDEIVFVDRGQQPLMRLHVHYPPLEYHLKTEARIWGDWVVVGFAGRVVLVSIHDGVQREIVLSDVSPPYSFDYFCQLFSDDDVLLVCSGRRVFRIGTHGEILWKSDELGLDGVLVHRVCSTAISGDGEWDPPGGWQPFSISLDTGLRISG